MLAAAGSLLPLLQVRASSWELHVLCSRSSPGPAHEPGSSAAVAWGVAEPFPFLSLVFPHGPGGTGDAVDLSSPLTSFRGSQQEEPHPVLLSGS